MPRDKDDEDLDADDILVDGRAGGFWMLTELARREQFLFKGRDLNFYWMEDINCMSKYGGLDTYGGDTVVLFTQEKNSEGVLEVNPPMLNTVDVKSLQKLNRWVSTVISDIELKFTDRVAHTIMDEKMFAVVLLRNGGKPEGEEEFEEMLPDDQKAVQEFDKFIKIVKFKQNRALFFYADPFEDKPLDDITTI